MSNLAAFRFIGSVGGSSPSTDRGYDLTAGETLQVQLEASASLVSRATFEVYDAGNPESPLATLGAPTLTLDNGTTTGQQIDAGPLPNSAVDVTGHPGVLTAAHSWILRSTVDGGVDPATGKADPNRIFERIIALKGPRGERLMVPGETTQYSARTWSDDVNAAMATAAALQVGALVAALRAEVGIAGQVRYLRGHTTEGDGGEGTFRWSDTAKADDGGTVLNVGGLGTSSAGWRRIFDGHGFVAQWFGAFGLGATNDRPGLQLAINAAINAGVAVVKKAGRVLLRCGRYLLQDNLPLLCLVSNGAGGYSFCSVAIEGMADPFSSGATGTFSAAVIEQEDPEQACIVFQSARNCVVEKVTLLGQNAFSSSYPGNVAENHYDSTWATDIGLGNYDAPYVVAGRRDNRYSPHAGIVVDPFHDDVAAPDRYPGLGAYYTNTGTGGGSSQVHTRRCYIEDFVVGELLGANPTTQNVDTCELSATFISGCKTCLAIGQSQSRDVRVIGCTMGNAGVIFDCQRYGFGNGGMPLVTKGLYGSARFLYLGAAAGTPGAFTEAYANESLTSLGHFAGDRVTFDSCGLGFFPTPAGYPAYPKAFCSPASAPVFNNCSILTNDGGAARETFWFLGGQWNGGTIGGSLGASTDPGYGMHVVGYQTEWYADFLSHYSQDSSGQGHEGQPFVTRDQLTNLGSIDAPRRGGAFFTTLLDAAPGLAYVPSAESGNVQAGVLNVEVFDDGTAEITGANLDRTFAVGDVVEHLGGTLTNVIEGLAGTAVAICLGKVDTVTAGTVTTKDVPTYVADQLSAAGVVARNVIIWPRRRVHAPTTGTLASTTSITGVTPVTYWRRYNRIRDEDGLLGSSNYISVVSGTTITLAAPAGAASGDVYLYDQPLFDILRCFRTQQTRLWTTTTSVGQLNGALLAADIDFQVWTPRTDRGAWIAAGSTDKKSANGAWAGLAGFGSAHATTAYRSKAVLAFGGNATVELLIVAADEDGANQEIVGKIGRDGVPVTDSAAGTAANGTQFAALTHALPDDCVAHVTAIVNLKKAGTGAETIIYSAAVECTAGAATLQGPATGAAQRTFHQPASQAWGTAAGDGIDVSGGSVLVNLSLAAGVVWSVKIQVARLDS